MSRKVASVLLGLALGLSACFDVGKLESGPYYLDTFNDGNLLPRPPGFDEWRCGTFVSGGPDGGTDAGSADSAADGAPGTSCAIQQVGDHPMALTVQFELHETPDGIKQTVGAEVATHTVAGRTVDLSGFRQMVFSGILESGSPPLPGSTQLAVEIACRSARGGSSVSQTVGNVNIGSDWAPFRLALDDFLPPDRSCLLQAEGIRFSVRPGLNDGFAAAGTLNLDDIYFIR